jgi:hypothetical protein
MANPTSNFNWQMPTASDLVTDLPADFEVFGQAVDTSLADLKGGTTDQVLAKNSNTDMDFKWVTSDDANAIQNTIVDAKGDLIGATAADTPARLAVGTNGQVLTADSTAATGLAWTTVSGAESLGFTAGKNKIINGDFNVWQRGTTITSQYGYVSDRWLYYQNGSSGVTTISQQTFTPGNTIAGYEPTFFIRVNQTTAGTGATTNSIFTNLEDVRLFAGQTATISFWAKAGSGTPSITPVLTQVFGSGGSTAVTTSYTAIPITTSWARYTQTISIPSISGKTVGTSSYLTVNLGIPLNTVQTIDFWGVQLEAGSTATSFQTATGTIQGELAACQRYYFRNVGGDNEKLIANGFVNSTTIASGQIQFPVPMRVAPTSLDSSNMKFITFAGSGFPMTSILYNQQTNTAAQVYGTISGSTAGIVGSVVGSASGAYVGFSAEL